MIISDKIGNTHVEEMERILAFVTSFNVHKLLYAITEKRFDEDAIDKIRLDIGEQNIRLERQKHFLFNFTKTCNSEYALDDNKLVDSSARLSFRIRSGIKGVRNNLKDFYKKSRRRLPQGQSAPQAIDRSLIATDSYMKDLFGLESYPECVKMLFLEMVKFYNTMNDCLTEALRSLSEEKDIKGDKKRCLELLIQACDRSKQSQAIFIEAMENDPSLKAHMQQSDILRPNEYNPVLKAWVNSGGSEDFAKTYYHNCSPRDVGKITLYKTLTEADGDPDVMSCMTIFKCKLERAKKINYAISHFDSLLPEKPKRGQIPSTYLHAFMRWCSDTIGYETFLRYFNKRYRECGGKWEVITASALSGASAQSARSTNRYEEAKSNLRKGLDEMFLR